MKDQSVVSEMDRSGLGTSPKGHNKMLTRGYKEREKKGEGVVS